ncbi:MAG: hypothetical protein ACKOX6_08145 [Bdellovibrio sp.]
MKTLLATLVFLSVGSAHAACTQLEAQIVASVDRIVAEDATTCTVTLDYSKRYQFNSHILCPLSDVDASRGIVVSKYNNQCRFAEGGTISGIIYQSLNGSDSNVYLE